MSYNRGEVKTGTLYSTIWNKKDSISYSYFRGELTIKNRSIFTDYQISLVKKWDIATIRKEEGVNGNWLDNNLQINALKCYKVGKNWRVDEISFKNFCDPKRDH